MGDVEEYIFNLGEDNFFVEYVGIELEKFRWLNVIVVIVFFWVSVFWEIVFI